MKKYKRPTTPWWQEQEIKAKKEEGTKWIEQLEKEQEYIQYKAKIEKEFKKKEHELRIINEKISILKKAQEDIKKEIKRQRKIACIAIISNGELG